MVISTYHKKSAGFTLIEMMIVVAIIGILAAIAYPSYQQYVIKSKRADMMSEMQNIAQQIESRKLAQGNYKDITDKVREDFAKKYPSQGQALYTVTINSITPNPPDNALTAQWQIEAEPITGTQMKGDGNLTLNYQGIKCRKSACGTAEEWQ